MSSLKLFLKIIINDAKIHLHKSLHDNEDEAMLAAFTMTVKQSTLNINQPLCIKEREIRWVNLRDLSMTNSTGELSLVDRLKHHKAYQQRFTKEDASIQGARCMDCGTPFVKPDNSMVGKQ